MNKHTPGPWKASIGTRGAQIYIANDANHPLSFGFSWSESNHDIVREAQANARLIAAAPELLTAAKMVVDPMVSPERATAEVLAAIAKAEGTAVDV